MSETYEPDARQMLVARLRDAYKDNENYRSGGGRSGGGRSGGAYYGLGLVGGARGESERLIRRAKCWQQHKKSNPKTEMKYKNYKSPFYTPSGDYCDSDQKEKAPSPQELKELKKQAAEMKKEAEAMTEEAKEAKKAARRLTGQLNRWRGCQKEFKGNEIFEKGRKRVLYSKYYAKKGDSCYNKAYLEDEPSLRQLHEERRQRRQVRMSNPSQWQQRVAAYRQEHGVSFKDALQALKGT